MGLKHFLYPSLGVSIATFALAVSPALAEELHDWFFNAATSELTFSSSDNILPEFFLLSEPARLVLDIPDVEVGNIAPEQSYEGAVQTIRVSQYTPNQVRVVIELAPEIVLASAQADIQFDDSGDGQRHWSFRPLIEDGSAAVATFSTPTDLAPTPSRANRISLSAANLQQPERQSSSVAVPIDPYESELSDDVVSVPPLEDLLENDAPSPVEDSTIPDLPSMTVPELESAELDEVVVLPAVAAAPEGDRAGLPDISTDAQPGLSDATASPNFENLEPLEESVTEDVLPEETVVVAEDAPNSSNAISRSPMVENSEATVDTELLAEETSAVQPMETAQAPIELSRTVPQPEETENTGPTLQTIQQPAAERTIIQTELPTPLKFGQPLPGVSQ